MDTLHTLAFWAPNGFELLVVLVIALLLFGKRLPEVAKSLGKGIVEFKKGVKGIEEEVDSATYEASSPSPQVSHQSSPATKEPGGAGDEQRDSSRSQESGG